MNCFRHHENVAVGLCKFCGKGVCKDCVEEEDFGIICSDSCAESMRLLHELNVKVLKVYGIGEPPRFISIPTLVWMIPGIVFAGFSVFDIYRSGYADSGDLFGLVMGAMLLGVGAVIYMRNRASGLNC